MVQRLYITFSIVVFIRLIGKYNKLQKLCRFCSTFWVTLSW